MDWTAQPAPRAPEHPDSYWRSLYFFNVYRVAIAVLLLTVVVVWRGSVQFGSRSLTLFVVTVVFYVLFSILCFTLTRIRWRFNLQLAIQVAADIAFIVILMRASGGISSGLGLLLLATLAGAALISRGHLTIFYAALASIAVLLEHTYAILYDDASVTQYVQAGLLSGGYFVTAWLAYTLARYAAASERLAAQREVDLANMAQVNQLVIQDMQDGVLVVDSEGVIRQSNARAEHMLGALNDEWKTLLEDYSPALAASFDKWRRSSGGIEANSGPLFNNTINARFVPIGRTRQVGGVIFLEDLSRAQTQAQQMKLAALGRLTANIAHEVRNPLGAISHAAELLQEEPAISDTTRRLIHIIHDNSRRIDRMVNDVLRLNRGDRAQRESLLLLEFLQTFVEQFCEIERIRPEIFSIELDSSPRVLFDPSHLDQVMWNLCRNALRHCRREDGSIRIGVGTMRSGSIVKLDILDDGPGVPPELRGQLFEPFFTTAAGGTGLGLYIAREICDANGAILDYVETGGGAQFTVMCRTGG
ncbi:MAG: PAS domain-containing protein [Betaproteobacteria bacterium]|nr:PAS domain-containing protein [Betaproteobacteria bacterium]